MIAAGQEMVKVGVGGILQDQAKGEEFYLDPGNGHFEGKRGRMKWHV